MLDDKSKNSNLGENEENENEEIDRVEDQSPEGSKDKQVSYESYRRVLSEKKKMQERLVKFENEQKKLAEKKLKETDNFKELLELREKELSETKQELEQRRESEVNARKLHSFLDTLDGKIHKKYWGYVPIEKIIVDPDTNEIDKMSITKVVNEFRKEFPEIITVQESNRLPRNAPQQTTTGLTYDEWKALPLSEMRKRQKDIIKQ